MNPIVKVNAARKAAAMERAYWLMAVATDDQISAMDLIRHAATDDGRPLRRLTLKQVLLANGMGDVRARATLDRLRVQAEARDTPNRALTVGWLLDNRARGNRFLAWMDVVVNDRANPPWTNFPFAQEPAESIMAVN